MRQWRFIYDTPSDGVYNMAIDDAILEFVNAGDVLPTLRLYGWSPPCLSLGYGQRSTDADLDRLARLGWGIVRRPTGGKAILHADELTYSLTLPAEDPLAQLDIVASYREISRALMQALQCLGLQPQSDPADSQQLKQAGAVCFEMPSHYEITVGGRKLIGSAQLRRKGALLQHGSLPLTGDLARICDALVHPDEASREMAKARVHTRALTLEEAVGTPILWEDAANALVSAFEQVFDVQWLDDNYTAAELAYAELLVNNRYATLERRSSVL